MESLPLIFITSLGIGLSGAVAPGPLLALTLKESMGQGRGAALWLSGGHSLCELLMVTALAGGLSQLISIDKISGPIGVLGGLILVWMAFGTFKQSGATGDLTQGPSSRSRPHNLLLGGAAVTVSNPYWTVWWLTAGLALLLMSTKAGPAGIISFYIGHISADFLWFGFVGFIVAWRSQMLSGKVYRRILQACAGFLLVFGILFGVYGIRIIHSAILS